MILNEEDKFAYEELYPPIKYEYQALIPSTSGMAIFSLENNGVNITQKEEYINIPDYPRQNPSIRIVDDNFETIQHVNHSNEIMISSFNELIKKIISYHYIDDGCDIVDLDSLKKGLIDETILICFSDGILKELKDYKKMKKVMKLQFHQGDYTVPYNRCQAIIMIMYYFKYNQYVIYFMKSMHFIIGNCNGLLDAQDMLQFPKSMKVIDYDKASIIESNYPSLADMQRSSYRFRVLYTNTIFIKSSPKSFSMNRLTYYDFNEQYEDEYIDNDRIAYFYSMIYTLQLLIPDEESFNLGKSIGFIDSNKVDWYFWRENVISYKLPKNMLIHNQFDLLQQIKSDYFNFTKNLLTDYRRKSVQDPVTFVFNIMAIIFALTGVIQVFQQANIIPSLK
ncbi:unnamed protein product [Cunninghamella blakesleeana]